jgi:hypothetical protein
MLDILNAFYIEVQPHFYSKMNAVGALQLLLASLQGATSPIKRSPNTPLRRAANGLGGSGDLLQRQAGLLMRDGSLQRRDARCRSRPHVLVSSALCTASLPSTPDYSALHDCAAMLSDQSDAASNYKGIATNIACRHERARLMLSQLNTYHQGTCSLELATTP